MWVRSMRSTKKNYFIIVFYGILLTFLLLGGNHLYGSNIDWLTQHTVIPEYFRNLFYETGRILPNLAMELGAGQNIFHYSYYGLLSPLILPSYLLPFVSMTSYVMIVSIFLYLSSGILLYRFLKHHAIEEKIALFVSLVFLTLSPLTYHFHHHIMFVWYIPFLLMGLMGVDQYVEKDKSFLFMVSVFLLIMTNYYYSVPSLLVLVIYGVYRLLSKKSFSWKEFFLDVLKASIRIFVPIFMAGILLFPTAYVILHGARTSAFISSFWTFFKVPIQEVAYSSFGMGLSCLLLLSPVGVLCKRKKTRSEIFLSILLLIVSFFPLVMYMLNGMLYVRGKVLIPFLPLYMYVFAKFLQSLKKEEILYKAFIFFAFLVIFLLSVMNFYEKLLPLFLIDFVITFISLYLMRKYKKISFVLFPCFFILLSSTFVNNAYEDYVSIATYREHNNYEDLLKKVDDGGFYRTDNLVTYDKLNKNYGKHYNNTTIYSSNFNSLYWKFYHFDVGNNIQYRNLFITGGTDNVLFHDLMGVKYIVSLKKAPIGYKKIASVKEKSLYLNSHAYPIVYTTSALGDKTQYEKLTFPYNLDYMMKHPIVNDGNSSYTSSIKEEDWDLLDTYSFSLKKDTTYQMDLPTSLNQKVLFIVFSMQHNDTCDKEKDKKITINGVSNKLTCSDWLYYNQNEKFSYVISSNEEINKLKIKLSKGTYKISDIHIYTMDYQVPTFLELSSLRVDKKKSMIMGTSQLKEDGYLITSIPYDEGFHVFVDGKEIKKEIVNQAFLGAKLKKGDHKVQIKYTAPWFVLGCIFSFFGSVLFLGILVYECFRKKIEALFLKYREILLYIVFGILTTIVSLALYYLCIFTMFDPMNAVDLQIANVISWIGSVLFAYITNRKYVFSSKSKNYGSEMVRFYSSRLFTLILDMLLMAIFVSGFKFNDKIVKLFVQIIVIIANYIFSKLMVFKEVRNGKN